MRLLTLTAVLTALVVHAEELTPENMAKIQREQAKATEAVNKKYGNKKSSELSSEERKAMIKEKAEAERSVLQKHGVDPKEHARAGAKMSRDDRAATEAAVKDQDAQEAATAKKGVDGKKATGKKEIVIERDGKSNEPVNEAAEMDKQMGLKK